MTLSKNELIALMLHQVQELYEIKDRNCQQMKDAIQNVDKVWNELKDHTLSKG